MSERQEKAWVVVRRHVGEGKPVKVFDGRQDARDYAARMGARSIRYEYRVFGVRRG